MSFYTVCHHKKKAIQPDIQFEAFLLWEKAGKPEGMSDHFWKLAEEKCGIKPKPVKVTSWVCSSCGRACFYDGRCGDGPIRMCNCWSGNAIDAADYRDARFWW